MGTLKAVKIKVWSIVQRRAADEVKRGVTTGPEAEVRLIRLTIPHACLNWL